MNDQVQPTAGTPPKRGRPCVYTPEIADEIFERLSNGEPLRQICRDDHMPAWRTVYDWKRDDEEFAARFTRARDIGFDAIAEETLDLVDADPERVATEFGSRVDAGHVQWTKNRVEQRLKLLAKWSPRYREKVDVDAKVQSYVMQLPAEAESSDDWAKEGER